MDMMRGEREIPRRKNRDRFEDEETIFYNSDGPRQRISFYPRSYYSDYQQNDSKYYPPTQQYQHYQYEEQYYPDQQQYLNQSNYSQSFNGFQPPNVHYSIFGEEQNFSNEYSGFDEGLGQLNVGRFGKPDSNKKKKKKKKKKETKSPPQPKTKEHSSVYQFSQEFYNSKEEVEVQMAICPFNQSHMMAPNKLQTHIRRCWTTCPNAQDYRQCKYNCDHWFRKDKIQAHQSICPDRKKAEEDQYQQGFYSEDPSDPFGVMKKKKNVGHAECEVIETYPPNPIKKIIQSNPEKKKYEQYLIQDF